MAKKNRFATFGKAFGTGFIHPFTGDIREFNIENETESSAWECANAVAMATGRAVRVYATCVAGLYALMGFGFVSGFNDGVITVLQDTDENGPFKGQWLGKDFVLKGATKEHVDW